MNTRTLVGILIAVVLVVGAGWIIYQNRPVMQLQATGSTTSSSTASGTSGATADVTYSLADIQLHNTPASCWSTINGGVYDLTSWISRHPGGAGVIQGMCGTDGGSAFRGEHGSSRKPNAALVLLKIGTLK